MIQPAAEQGGLTDTFLFFYSITTSGGKSTGRGKKDKNIFQRRRVEEILDFGKKCLANKRISSYNKVWKANEKHENGVQENDRRKHSK
jgi:hypothetical protein